MKSITAMLLALTACGGAPFSAITEDSGGKDSGVLGKQDPEAGSPEAGSPEAGSPEAGSPEAGSPKAGSPEAGSLPEAGSPEASAPLCCTVTDQTAECTGVMGMSYSCTGGSTQCYATGACWYASPGTGTCDGVVGVCQ